MRFYNIFLWARKWVVERKPMTTGSWRLSRILYWKPGNPIPWRLRQRRTLKRWTVVLYPRGWSPEKILLHLDLTIFIKTVIKLILVQIGEQLKLNNCECIEQVKWQPLMVWIFLIFKLRTTLYPSFSNWEAHCTRESLGSSLDKVASQCFFTVYVFRPLFCLEKRCNSTSKTSVLMTFANVGQQAIGKVVVWNFSLCLSSFLIKAGVGTVPT
jgi:hypothetical protein